MRSRFTFVLVALLVTAAILIAGCGVDAGQAEQDIQAGDAAVAKVQPASKQLSAEVSSLLNGVFAGGKVDPATFQKDAAAVRTDANKVLAGTAAAKSEYAKVKGLTGVAGYKEYASLQAQIVDLNDSGLKVLVAFVDKWSPAIAQASFDPVAFVGAAKELSTQSEAIATQIEKLQAQAAALKKAQKL